MEFQPNQKPDQEKIEEKPKVENTLRKPGEEIQEKEPLPEDEDEFQELWGNLKKRY